MTILIAALVISVALVMAGLAVRDGLQQVSKSFGWGEQTAYVDLDKLLSERAQEELDNWDEGDLVLGSDL